MPDIRLINLDTPQQALLKGVNTLANVVSLTLGPKGRNVVLEKKYGLPLVVNDGVTIAKEIELEDPFESLGCKLTQQASSQTNDKAGDGTTTSTILTQAILNAAIQYTGSGFNPLSVNEGINLAVDRTVKYLKSNSSSVDSNEKIEQIAVISANSKEIGRILAEGLEQVGKDGVMTVEESKTAETTCEVVEGMQFDRGYLSPYMVTDSEKSEGLLENAVILITDGKITNIQDILPLLEQIVQQGKKLLIVAEDVEGDALATLIVNKLRGTFTCIAVKAPGFGDRRKDMLADIAVLTGGTVISSDLGLELKKTTIEQLGNARMVKVHKDDTIIVGGAGNSDAIKARIAQIKAQIEETTSEFDKEKLQERLAKLSGGVAVVKVGAATEVEMKEKKLRIEDALAATKAAIEEGIVPGGGTAYINAIKEVEKLLDETSDDNADGGKRIGIKVILKALEAPLIQIAKNANLDGSVIAERVKNSDKGTGFNVLTEKYVDMISEGIIDPTKVARSALQNAASVATMILTTGALVAYKPDPKGDAAAAAAMAGAGGGMY